MNTAFIIQEQNEAYPDWLDFCYYNTYDEALSRIKRMLGPEQEKGFNWSNDGKHKWRIVQRTSTQTVVWEANP